MDSVNLGDLVKDKVSGFTGIATSRTEFLNGCVRFGVSPNELDKDKKPIPIECFDEEQLLVVEPAAYERPHVLNLAKENPALTETTGGDRYTPIERPNR